MPTIEELQDLLRELQVNQHSNILAHSTFRAMQHLLHELQVHQVELEMQNRELREAREELEASHNRYVDLYDFAPCGYLTFDGNGCILEINLTGARMLGSERLHLIGKSFVVFVAHTEINQFLAHIRRCRLGEETVLTELTLKGPNPRSVQLLSVPTRAEAEQINVYRTIFTDITERKQTQQALHKAEVQYRQIVETAQEGIWVIDTTNKTIFANARMAELLGCTGAELLGASLFDFMDAEGKQIAEAQLTRRRQGIAEQHDFKFRRQDGTDLWAIIETNPIFDEDDQYTGALAMVTDITEHKRMQEELASYQQLRALTARLQSIREEERTYIAREIHDELGQTLTGLKIELVRLGKSLTVPAKRPTSEKIQATLSALAERVENSIEATQRICIHLRPGVLDNLGLLPALEWEAAQFESRTGIRWVQGHMTKTIVLADERATTLYRIFQELLTNVARHAKATEFRVSLRHEKKCVVLKVVDNGRGISEQEIAAANSLGILGMRERLLTFAGTIHFRGQSGKGTHVTVRLPIDEQPLEGEPNEDLDC